MTCKPTVFAIDFGTTNSLLAAAAPGWTFDPVALDPRAQDPTILRSALHFTTADDAVCGHDALERYFASGLRGRLMRSVKRHLPSPAFEATRIGSRRVTIEQIIGVFLRTMRERAVQVFDTDVDQVVLGRPARFAGRTEDDALAQKRLDAAARNAGFRGVSFCYEPVAAAYDFTEHLDRPRVVLIADLGGGTSDFTLALMGATTFAPDDVLAVGGVSIAGDAIDGALVRYEVAPRFGSNAPYRVPLGSNTLTMPGDLLRLLCSPAHLTLADQRAVLRSLEGIRHGLLDEGDAEGIDRYATLVADNVGFQLYESVEAAKVELSRNGVGTLRVDYPGIDLEQTITRKRFETAVADRVARICGALDETMTAGGVKPGDVEIVCLTGGTSLVPVIEHELRTKLRAARVVRLRSHHSVVHGLARCARMMADGHAAAGLVTT